MIERLSREERNFEDRINREDIEEGDEVIVEWSPYGWALDNEGLVGRHRAVVTEVHGISGDIRFKCEDGTVLRDYGGGRSHVSGPAENTDGVPDRTDVGKGCRYYPQE